jgi:ATP-dependent DNA ligase
MAEVQATEAALDILDRLHRRELTGNAAVAEITALFEKLGSVQAEALRRIILKDLKVGVSATTANKAIPNMVPEFCVQLAPNVLVKPEEVQYPAWVEPKWDGYRTIRKGQDLYSRDGNIFENFEEIRRELNRLLGDEVVLDFETMSTQGFNRLKKRAGASPGKNTDIPIYGVVYDVMSREQFEAKKCPTPFLQRREILTTLLHGMSEELVRLSEGHVVNNKEELIAFYDQCLQSGRHLDGLMVKTLNGLYTFKRNATWQKIKPFATYDLTIRGVLPGKPNGKYANTLGSVSCDGWHDDKFIVTDVGMGFSDALRDEWWANPPIGTVIEVRALEITKAENGEHFALRHGSLVRVREDKNGATEKR